ncbi:hypothetical protein [Gracilibacillus xinjiangensis]|uniref:SGNH/GDSL hydrolase family protein n=1 Tax=Gracilibacillus xinjiangensis TaxID=1193282 RepID=A0ABV8WVE7_9BACI
MSYKSFNIIFLVIILLGLGSVAGFNFFIDPLWTFQHNHKYNDVQVNINERQLKVNQIHFSKDFDYDTLLLGSSRTTYIHPGDFENMDVYNFAASDLSFKEYKSMIDFAKKEKGSEFERIIIGVDFNKSSMEQSAEDLTLDEYIDNATSPFYRYKNLLSLDVLNYAKKNYRLSKDDKIILLRSYNRYNMTFAREFQPETIRKETEAKVVKFRKLFYGDNYEYNPEFKEVLQQIKEDNPNTEFVIFTSPISAPLFEAIVDEGNLDDYHHWLNEIIDVFGGVYNFMGVNTVTSDILNYFDGHHYYPHVGEMIAKRISADNPTGVPDDFGIYLTEHVGEEEIQ